MQDSLKNLVLASWECGSGLDLSGIGYGRIHWGDKKSLKMTPGPYYFFLAGLVKVIGAQRVLEIGTHSGGSAMAMEAGMHAMHDAQIATVDITSESDAYLKNSPTIKKFTGDANSLDILEELLIFFDFSEIDLLFVDAEHSCFPTLLNFSIYNTLLKPRLIVLDDIQLNNSMKRLWSVLKHVYKEQAINVVDILPNVRPGNPSPGFGLVMCRLVTAL